MSAAPSESLIEDLYATGQHRVDEAAEFLHLDDDLHAVLREVKRVLQVHFPVVHDDGAVEVYTGYRVHHSIARGPAKGESATSVTRPWRAPKLRPC